MKKTAYLFFSLLFLMAFAGGAIAQTMTKEAVQPFNDGLEKTKKGNYKDALTDFEKALQFDKDYRIYYQIGFAQMKLNNLDSAIENYKNSIKVNPKFDAAYNDLGNVYYSQGKYQDAIDNFLKVLETSKDSTINAAVKFNISLSYTGLSSTAEKEKNYKKAVVFLNKAVTYNDYDFAYLSLARIYVQTSQYDRAIQAAEKALKYKKNIKEGGPNYYMGVAYSQKGDMKKAKEYLNKAKEDPVYKSAAETVLKAIK